MRITRLAAAFWFASLVPGVAGPQGFTVHDTPQDMPEVRFVTEDGTSKTLDAFHGKVIVLNIWATWCPPCVAEMPTLDALQADLGSGRFEVVTLSIDTGGVPVVRRFFDKLGIKHLTIRVDPTQLSFTNLHIVGLPTTLLINADGKEVARLVGPATWNAPAVEAFLKGFAQ
ncbi:MAG: TlpA disulfide reductase family protein [bacterium]